MMLQVRNLVKKYGRYTAVDHLDMEIAPGHIFGFVGENGAGKTTTMRIIAGLLAPTSGEVYVDGEDMLASDRHVKRKIGYMPDFFGVYDNLKVDEYMDFYAGLYGIPYRERRKITDQLLELVNLSDKKEFYVDTLSRGMKQRLCLARSMIHNPKLMVLDEPASGLDPRARVEMKNILRELRNIGKTILISSHILSELSELCTMIGIINRGKMIACGTVEEINDKITKTGKLKITLSDKVDEAVRILKEHPSTGEIYVSGNVIEADTSANKEELSMILRNLVLQDVPVISYSQSSGSLESVFMRLMEGSEQNDA